MIKTPKPGSVRDKILQMIQEEGLSLEQIEDRMDGQSRECLRTHLWYMEQAGLVLKVPPPPPPKATWIAALPDDED